MTKDDMIREIEILYARAGDSHAYKVFCNDILSDVVRLRGGLPKSSPNWIGQRLEEIEGNIIRFFIEGDV